MIFSVLQTQHHNQYIELFLYLFPKALSISHDIRPHLDKAVELLRQIRPFYSCIHFVKSSQTLVKWAFQGTITNSLHTFLPYFKHFLRIFAIRSVGLCHIKPLIIMLYSHLFFYTIYRNLCIIKKNAYKACKINVCREFLFINSFVIYTIYRNVSAVNKKSCNLSKIKGFQT